jgi:hypothetical protein
MYCPKCGKENPDNAQLCQSCNYVLTSVSPPSAPVSFVARRVTFLGEQKWTIRLSPDSVEFSCPKSQELISVPKNQANVRIEFHSVFFEGFNVGVKQDGKTYKFKLARSDLSELHSWLSPRLGAGISSSKGVGGMFLESDYIPFMLGIFIIGGLLVIPLTWGLGLDLGYFAALPWSLLSCIVFLIAFRRNGTISWGRAIPAIVASMILTQVHAQSTGRPAFVVGGILGFLAIVVFGYIGIWIGRLVRREKQ